MKTFIRYLGFLLVLSAFFRIVPIVTALYYGESFFSFMLVALISLVLGMSLVFAARRFPEKKDIGLSLSGGLMLAALSFILLPLLGAISFLPSFDYHFLDAAFESVSGFTTTGLTLYDDLESLPKALLMWRAMTQWIGGIGIVIVFLFIFSRLHSHDYIRLADIEEESRSTVSLYQAQGFDAKLGGGLRSSVGNIMIVYLGYTILGIVLLLLTGLPIFEAVALTFTSLSTGGFSVTNQFYTGTGPLLILSVLMLLGSISFLAHIKIVQGKWLEFLKTFEKNIFLIIVLVAILFTLLVVSDFKAVGFMLISAFTTTGFGVSEIALLPHFFIFMITLGMLMGGNIASTSGGIKTYRFYYLLRAIPWSLKKLSSPAKAIIPLQIHGETVDEVKLANIGIFVYTYVLILFLGIGLFMLFGHSFLTSSFQMISALGTVGLQTIDLSTLEPILKVILMVAMLLGRLEIFPILILVRRIFK